MVLIIAMMKKAENVDLGFFKTKSDRELVIPNVRSFSFFEGSFLS